MEGTAKKKFDVVIGVDGSGPWKIDTLVFDSKLLNLEFNSCCFCWVKRVANGVAYKLAKFAGHQSLVLCCTKHSLTLSVLEAWLSDVLFYSFWMKSLFSEKRLTEVGVDGYNTSCYLSNIYFHVREMLHVTVT